MSSTRNAKAAQVKPGGKSTGKPFAAKPLGKGTGKPFSGRKKK